MLFTLGIGYDSANLFNFLGDWVLEEVFPLFGKSIRWGHLVWLGIILLVIIILILILVFSKKSKSEVVAKVPEENEKTPLQLNATTISELETESKILIRDANSKEDVEEIKRAVILKREEILREESAKAETENRKVKAEEEEASAKPIKIAGLKKEEEKKPETVETDTSGELPVYYGEREVVVKEKDTTAEKVEPVKVLKKEDRVQPKKESVAPKKEETKKPEPKKEKKVETKKEVTTPEKKEVTTAKEEPKKKRKTIYRLTKRDEDNKWLIKKDGADRPVKLFDLFKEAEDFGRDLAKKNNATLMIYTQEGSHRYTVKSDSKAKTEPKE
ncbi:MAG: DUF2188 domain-containing protein [Bacillales bacterium]|jgi:hypothetical protein|nr:DUF2188 domain-containing protein [Bacillales bacterium]